MPEMLFCYCCRVHHPKEAMRPFPTRSGVRWRCTRSIEAAARSRQERDSFGRRQTAMNHEGLARAREFASRLRSLRLDHR